VPNLRATVDATVMLDAGTAPLQIEKSRDEAKGRRINDLFINTETRSRAGGRTEVYADQDCRAV